jgi:3-methyl-2-oxobutanoate hydroxymethyltransferase
MEDMLGLSPNVPKFVKKFGAIGAAIDRAIASYAEEVRARTFPAPEHTYSLKSEEIAAAAPPTRVTKKPKTPST